MLLNSTPNAEILVVTKGHPYDRNAFSAMLDEVLAPNGAFAPDSVQNALCEHRAACGMLNPRSAHDFQAIMFYDMPGLDLRPDGLRFVPPPAELVQGMEGLLAEGKPLFFLHHAVAGWPAWADYAKIIGGRFHYRPGPGHRDSGYRHGVTHRVRVVAEHPVTQGLGDGFEIEDECYLLELGEDDKLPLLRSDHRFEAEGFWSAAEAVAGRMYSNAGWDHKPGSDLILWAKRSGNSPVLYFQCGDGPSAYANPGFRTVIRNGIGWLISPAAREWALSRS